MTNLPLSPLRKSLFDEFENLSNFLDQYSSGQTFRTSQLTHRIDPNVNPVVVEIEVPGVEPSEVKVKIEGRALSVESPKGSVYITIGQRLDADGATANLKHGLLTIKIPKRDARIVDVLVHGD